MNEKRWFEGHDQWSLPSKCPHPECQKRYGKKEVQVSTLGNSLLETATQKIQKQVIDEFKRKLSAAEREAQVNKGQTTTYERYISEYTAHANRTKEKQSLLDANVEAAKAALAAIEAAFGATTSVAQGKFPRYAGQKFHLDSKTGGAGHFMKIDANGRLVCSCPASTFGNPCWAVKHIEENLSRGDFSYGYISGDRNFDARVRPASTYFRVPGYTGRRYDRYARLG